MSTLLHEVEESVRPAEQPSALMPRSPTNLMSLPTELRVEIFKMAIVPTIAVEYNWPEAYASVPLVRVSRQIREEALYAMTWQDVQFGLNILAATEGPQSEYIDLVSALRDVTVELHFDVFFGLLTSGPESFSTMRTFLKSFNPKILLLSLISPSDPRPCSGSRHSQLCQLQSLILENFSNLGINCPEKDLLIEFQLGEKPSFWGTVSNFREGLINLSCTDYNEGPNQSE